MYYVQTDLLKLKDQTDVELLQLKYLDLEIERDQLLDRVQAMATTLEEYRLGLEKWKKIAVASRELLSCITEERNY